MTRFSLISHDAEISIHVNSMTRNAYEDEFALLDLTIRHMWKVKKREENRILTVDDIIDPENRTLKIHEFQTAFAGASRMKWKLIFRRLWWLKVLSKLFTNVLAEDETDGTRGKPIFSNISSQKNQLSKSEFSF